MSFSAEQLANAEIIIRVGQQLGASPRDIQIALMTAMQESSLRNLPHGDRDSVGLFQQRAPWGSFAERTNPETATRMFFEGGRGGQRGLFDFPQRNNLTLTQAAQKVQVSAFPGAYAKHEQSAGGLLQSITPRTSGPMFIPASTTPGGRSPFDVSPGASPGSTDADGDGLSDEFERLFAQDRDRDGLDDRTELLIGTDIANADSDGDGLSDSLEVTLGTNPRRQDSDGDGIPDRVEAHQVPPAPVASGSNSAQPPVGQGAQSLRVLLGQSTATDPAAPGSLTATQAPAGVVRPAAGAAGLVQPAVGGPTSAVTAEQRAGQAFLQAALAQRGDRYVFGAETRGSDPDPDKFDCSELVQWAAHQAGVTVPDGATFQYLDLKAKGMLIPVEQAMNTPGALLFSFSSEPVPGGGRPGQAHVAISQGNGTTIEARSSDQPVGEFPAAGRFQFAAVIPGLRLGSPLPGLAAAGFQIDQGATMGNSGVGADDLTADFLTRVGSSAQPRDTDGDGLLDSLEFALGTDPRSLDTDRDGLSDGLEVLHGSDPLRIGVGSPDEIGPGLGPTPGGATAPDLDSV